MSEPVGLPGQSDAQLRSRRAIVLVLLAAFVYFTGLAQSLALSLGFGAALGKPLLAHPPIPDHLLLIAALAAALLATVLALSRRALLALPFGLLAALSLAFSLGGPLYSPVHLLRWLVRLRTLPAARSMVGSYTAAALAGLVVTLPLVLSLALRASRGKLDIHGSARWADHASVESTRLLESPLAPRTLAPRSSGVVLGLWSHRGRLRPLVVKEDRNVLVTAPPRSGKGVGIVIPTLLSWDQSVVVYDTKGENWHKSAGFRASELGQITLRFNPTSTDPGDVAYNPLAEVRTDDNVIRDVSNIVDLIVNPDGTKDPTHWDLTATALLTATLLHVLHVEDEKTLPACARFLSRPNQPIRTTLEAMRDTAAHPVIAEIAQSMLNKSADELSGVLSTAETYLQIFRDPLVARATSRSDFAIRDLMHAATPLSLYLVIPPSDISRVRPLIRILINQTLRRLTETMDFEAGATRKPENRLLVLVDELATLGRLNFFETNLAYTPGYGITTLLVTQDLTQLHRIYTEKESITANADYQVFLTPNKLPTAEYISRMCGVQTVHHSHRSRQVGSPLASSHTTLSNAENRRPLLTPDEVLKLPKDLLILFSRGNPPILTSRLVYYADPELNRRSLIPPPQASDRLPHPNPWDGLRRETPSHSTPVTRRMPRRAAAS